MTKSLFARPAPKRGVVVVMLAGALLVHGGLVGIGALFVQPPPPLPPDILWEDEPNAGNPLPPKTLELPEVTPTDKPEATATPELIDPSVSTPPPVTDTESFAEPVTPPPQRKTVARPATSRPKSTSANGPVSSSVGGRPEGVNGAPSSGFITWSMPQPPYPSAARKFSTGTGTTVLRITTDVAGRISKVEIVHSTGNPILDTYTASFVREHWHGPANASRTTEFVYQLR